MRWLIAIILRFFCPPFAGRALLLATYFCVRCVSPMLIILWLLRLARVLGWTRILVVDEGPYLHEVTVGQSELPVKAEMDFTFDYGDYWRFKVQLEKVDLGSSCAGQPKVIESAGEPPPQYPPAE